MSILRRRRDLHLGRRGRLRGLPLALQLLPDEVVDRDQGIVSVERIIAQGQALRAVVGQSLLAGGGVPPLVEIEAKAPLLFGVLRRRLRLLPLLLQPADGRQVLWRRDDLGQLVPDVLKRTKLEARHVRDDLVVERQFERLPVREVVLRRAAVALEHPRVVHDLVHGGAMFRFRHQHAGNQVLALWFLRQPTRPNIARGGACGGRLTA